MCADNEEVWRAGHACNAAMPNKRKMFVWGWGLHVYVWKNEAWAIACFHYHLRRRQKCVRAAFGKLRVYFQEVVCVCRVDLGKRQKYLLPHSWRLASSALVSSCKVIPRCSLPKMFCIFHHHNISRSVIVGREGEPGSHRVVFFWMRGAFWCCWRDWGFWFWEEACLGARRLNGHTLRYGMVWEAWGLQMIWHDGTPMPQSKAKKWWVSVISLSRKSKRVTKSWKTSISIKKVCQKAPDRGSILRAINRMAHTTVA